MHDLAAALDSAVHDEHRRTADGMIGRLPDIGPHHDVGRTGFILDRQEDHPSGRAGPLLCEHDAGHLDAAAFRSHTSIGGGDDSPRRQSVAFEVERMRPEGEARGAIVSDHFVLPRHLGQEEILFFIGVALVL